MLPLHKNHEALPDFEFVLFYTALAFAREAAAAGLTTFLVDWEQAGKRARQHGFNTQINAHTAADLDAVARAGLGRVICRVNSFGAHTGHEIDRAVDGGADEILLPMVQTVAEAEAALGLLANRAPHCRLGLMIETEAAVRDIAAFARLPLSRFYIGLNDLYIERRTPHLFTALVDGTVEAVAHGRGSVPFGFAGLTVIGCGAPLPCLLLLHEMTRLGASFGVLRRSFLRDIQGRDLAAEVETIRQTIRQSRQRSAAERERDRLALVETVVTLPVP